MPLSYEIGRVIGGLAWRFVSFFGGLAYWTKFWLRYIFNGFKTPA